jgi:hypothetical protein
MLLVFFRHGSVAAFVVGVVAETLAWLFGARFDFVARCCFI